MNMKRVTITIPEYTYSEILNIVPARGISNYISSAVEEKNIRSKSDPVEEFISLRNMLPKFSGNEIKAAIKKGRL